MTLLIAILSFVFVIGLCIGSFLNVVILRALSEESIVFPASKCPKCQTPLKWWHNIPLFSYILLRGKCAFCKCNISIQYPIIELLTGLIFTALFIKFGFSINTLYTWIVASFLIIIAGTDIKEKVVFDVHTYSLIFIGFIYTVGITVYTLFQINQGYNIPNLTLLNNPIVNGLAGLVFGIIIMEVLARLGYIFAGTRAFGEGDTLIAAGLGMVFGWQELIAILIYSIIIQVVLFLPIFIIGLIKQKEWKTFSLFTGFVLYAIAFYSLQNLNIINNNIVYSIGAIVLALIGILTCFSILKGLKENIQNRTYLPFGPAMVIAALIAFFI